MEVRLYRCDQCSRIYRKTEIAPADTKPTMMLTADCPVPVCRGKAFFGQGSPREVGVLHGIIAFVVTIVGALAFGGAPLGGAIVVALAVAAIVTGLSRHLHRPSNPAEDLHYAADVMAHQGEEHQRAGRLPDAQLSYERAVALLAGGVNARLEAAAVGRLANIEKALGDFGMAKVHYEAALALAEGLGDRSGILNRCNNLAALLGDDLNDPVAAVPYLERALHLAREMHDSDREVMMLNHLAERERERGRIAEAAPLVDQAVSLAERQGTTALIAESLFERGCLAMTVGDDVMARADLQRALELCGGPAGSDLEPRSPPSRPQDALDPAANQAALRDAIVRALHTAAAAAAAGSTVVVVSPGAAFGGDEEAHDSIDVACTPAAERVLEPAMTHLAGNRLGPATVAFREAMAHTSVQADPVALSLAGMNLGDVLRQSGDVTQAVDVLSSVISASECSGSTQLQAGIRLNLGLTLRRSGAWAEASRHLEAALDLSSEQPADQARVQIALGDLRRDTGDLSEAAELYADAARSTDEFGISSLQGAVAQSRGNLWFKQARWDEARPYYERARQIARETRDAHLEGISTHMLANVYRRTGAVHDAQRLLEGSTSLAQLDELSGGLPGRLNDLAVVEEDLGLQAEARDRYGQAAELYRRRGIVGPELAGCLENLGRLSLVLGEYEHARRHLTDAAVLDAAFVPNAFAITSESNRLRFLGQSVRRLNALVSLVAEGGPFESDPSVVRSCADTVVQRKGLTIETSEIQRQAALGGAHPELAEALRAMVANRQAIADLTLAGLGVNEDGSPTETAAGLHRTGRELAREATRHFPELELAERLRTADCAAVAARLPEGSALVEYLRFDFMNTGRPRYAAFVVPADGHLPVEVADLGSATEIDDLVQDYRNRVIELKDHRRIGDRLRSAVFDPITARLGAVRHILVAPDATLCLLPFATLPADGDHGYLIDHYHFSYLGTGRDLIRFDGVQPGRATRPLVVAAPNFNLQADLDTADAPRPDIPRPLLTLTGEPFAALPGSLAEARLVADKLGVQPVVGDAAVETVVKRSTSPAVVHLATHGFFLPRADGTDAGDQAEHPLMRSGLAFAGANTFLANGPLAPGAEDGLLTGEDVSMLDLSGTALAVLSACDTGVGVVHAGEGVFGLGRAFVQAGVRSLVMSLWPVPDEQTRDLMAAFYDRLFDPNGVAPSRALREAQLTVHARSDHPVYWGAFVCQGDDAPLSLTTVG